MNAVIVKSSRFNAHYPVDIPKNTVNAEAVLIRLDSEWDGLPVRIHWLNVASGVEKVVLLERDKPNTIPWEVLTDLGELRMGLVGMDGDTVIKPTIWLTYGYVSDGVDPDAGEDPQPPTPSWEQQMVALAEASAKAAKAAKETADRLQTAAESGEFNGDPGPAGPPGKSPIIRQGTWWIWDNDSQDYKDTGVVASGGGGGGVSSYNDLADRPKIGGVLLEGNKTAQDLGLQPAGDYAKKEDIPTISEDMINGAVSDFLEQHPELVTSVADGSITVNKLTQELSNELGLERHEYTESPVELKRAVYNSFYNGVESPNGTSTSTVLFKTPQKIRIENNHTQDITVTASRFANNDDYEGATYKPGSKSNNARREASFLNETIPMGESVTFDTYEYGSSGAEYIQLRFQPGAWQNAWNNIKVYAIYDSWRPTYTLPKANGIYEEDIPVRYTFQGAHYALNSQELIAVAPYYPDFTYNIRGGHYENTEANTLDVIYLMDNSIFDGYHDNITNKYFTSGHKNIPCIFPEKAETTQYDTSVNAGANSDYAWAYFKTPPETELIGPKWVAIIGMYAIQHSASEDLGQEYYNEQIQTLNDSGPQLRYVTKFNDKNAPRRLLSTYVKRVDKQSDGTYYTSILKQSDNPLAGKKWTLFGDSLTDAYGGHDLTGNYFASKIAREFGMILDNRAKGGGNINTGANGNYTSINGCACLDQLISDVEDGITDPPDYITVAYGTNGYTAQNGTVDDTSENKETTCGAVKYFIEKCTEKFPNAFLGFVLPPLGSWSAEDGQEFPNPNKDIDAARDAIRSILDLPEYGGIPYIDMSKKSGITLDMLPDKIHISSEQANSRYYRAIRGFLVCAWS